MAGHPGGPRAPTDFSRAPFLAIWETTRSCALACAHCRASAILGRDPRELTTAEGKDVLDQAAGMGTPIFILSGGDPLNRPDLEGLVRHGKARGLRMGTIPAATDNIAPERIRGLKDAGLDQVAFSLDAPTAPVHDDMRGIPGSFDKTLRAVDIAHQAGLPVQINTCLAARNFEHLEGMVRLVKKLDIVFWEVFFLVPIGRGAALQSISAEQFEAAFERLHRLNSEAEFVIKLTEAPHYRRYVIEKEQAAEGDSAKRIQCVLARERGIKGAIGLSPQAVNAGKGFLFIDHLGDICPSGFLPIPAGNVRKDKLADVYRNSPLFRDLRDAKKLKGKCGCCEFAEVCSGSRARAYAVTGDYLAEEPFCAYVPKIQTPKA
ncbi:MAG: TIGR04053 family radical SAM/SPASM domain-containing protein [Elusimicrobia bacterium]|nr:TIGR04053 family radical SAM/SPASM domain-containing protein [Elusimicrobiota bacterium]